MQAAITHILPLTLIRRRRVLPFAGRVLVSEGQKVNAVDVIAEASRPGPHTLIDVRRELGFARTDEAEKHIERLAGETIQQGDVIAQTGGLFRRILNSPVAGRIIAISAGRVLIESAGQPLQVRSGLAGVVRELIPDRGALIETSGALVQGLIGNDRVDQGVLVVLARSPEDEFVKERLDVSMRGAVVLAGHCSRPDALQAASELALRGLILSSVTADCLPILQKAEYPIVVLEGIGVIPFDKAAYQVLTTSEKRDICVNACAYLPYADQRPELIVPLPSIGELPIEASEFKAGKQVRILAAPYAAQVGTLVQVGKGLTKIKNGILAPAGEVRLENNETLAVPLANLDMLE
jgi:hypothetical protein